MFKTNFSGHKKIWRGTEQFWKELPPECLPSAVHVNQSFCSTCQSKLLQYMSIKASAVHVNQSFCSTCQSKLLQYTSIKAWFNFLQYMSIKAWFNFLQYMSIKAWFNFCRFKCKACVFTAFTSFNRNFPQRTQTLQADLKANGPFQISPVTREPLQDQSRTSSDQLPIPSTRSSDRLRDSAVDLVSDEEDSEAYAAVSLAGL